MRSGGAAPLLPFSCCPSLCNAFLPLCHRVPLYVAIPPLCRIPVECSPPHFCRHHLRMSLSTPLIRFSAKPPLPPYVAVFPPLCRHRLLSPAPLFCCYFSFMKSSLFVSRHHRPVHPHTPPVTKSLNRSHASLTHFHSLCLHSSRVTDAPDSHRPCLMLLVFLIRSHYVFHLFFHRPCLHRFPVSPLTYSPPYGLLEPVSWGDARLPALP